jgi:H+-transporting ATPase
MLSVAGHLTIFQTRTRGPWWSIRPARILLLAVVGTQVLATSICVFGLLVTPLWWGWVAMVWGYALAWFLVTDPIKLLAYHVLDATKAEPTQHEPKAVAATGAEPKTQPEPESKDMPDTETKPEFAVKIAAGVETLANTTLGELLVAGALKHPEDAGHIIADAITAAMNATPPGTQQKAGETDSAGVKTLVNKTLGDLLLSGTLKHPEDAGRSIAEAITAAIGAAKHVGGGTEAHPQPVAPQPDTNGEIPAVAEGGPATPADAVAATEPKPGPDATAEAEPGAKAPQLETKTGVETLENTTLGALLLAGVLKHPEEAAHIIAGAMPDAEAPDPKVPN